VDIKDEMPEAIVLPPIKTENEVSFGVFVCCWQLISLGHLFAPATNCGIELNHFPLCVTLFFQYTC
jgi:hypothetical protein